MFDIFNFKKPKANASNVYLSTTVDGQVVDTESVSSTSILIRQVLQSLNFHCKLLILGILNQVQ